MLLVQDLSIYPDATGGGWYVAGLTRNISDSFLQDVVLIFTAQAADGSLTRTSFPLAWTHLRPGEEVPFEVLLGPFTPEGLELEPIGVRGKALERMDVVGEAVRVVHDGLRRQHVLGWVFNPESRPAEVVAALAVARDADGAIVDVAPISDGQFWLGAGEQRPFVARLQVRRSVASVQLYFDAEAAGSGPDASPVDIVQTEMRMAANGLPYWVGLIRSLESTPLWISGVVGVSSGGELVGAAAIDLPVPVAPGEVAAFALVDIPGVESWLRAGGEPASLEIELWLETRPLPEGQEVRHLAVRVRSVEAIGGTLFLRGLVQFPADEVVERAHIVAAVRDTAGNLISAGCAEVPDRQRNATDAEFLLTLPLPAGVQLSGLEYDLRALAAR